jgi:hypothetical protein
MTRTRETRPRASSGREPRDKETQQTTTQSATYVYGLSLVSLCDEMRTQKSTRDDAITESNLRSSTSSSLISRRGRFSQFLAHLVAETTSHVARE